MSSAIRVGCHVTLAVLAGVLFVAPAHVFPGNYPADDSYFYLEVASRIHAGEGTTFNGITSTNGYHPLWMAFCVLCSRAAGGDKSLALHLVIALQQLLAAGIVALFLRVGRQAGLRFPWLGVPVLFLLFSTRLYASEAYLSAFLCLLCLSLALQLAPRDAADRRGALLLGVAAGFAVLARLDNVFLVGALFLFLLLHRAGYRLAAVFSRGSIASGTCMGFAFLAVMAPYLAYNLKVFGHLTPISGAIKSSLPRLVFHADGLSLMGKVCALFAVLNLALALPSAQRPERRLLLLVLSVGFLLHAAQIVFTTNHHTQWPWYYVVGMINMAVSVCVLGETFAQRVAQSPRVAALFSGTALLTAALSLTVLVNVYAWARYRNAAPTIEWASFWERLREPPSARWQAELGAWLRQNLPPRARIVVYDWPGLVAYESGRPILAPDGLIHDYKYNDDLLREGTAAYLRRRDVAHWLGPCNPADAPAQTWYRVRAVPGGQEVEVFAPLYRKSAGTFGIRDEDRLVRFREVLRNPDTPDIALWKLR